MKNAIHASLLACLLGGTHAKAAEAPPAPVPLKAKTTYICQMANHHHMAGQELKEYDKPGICPTDGMEMIAKNSSLRVAVLMFDGVQDIDYAGPMEVFGQSGATIFTVGRSTDSLHSTYGVKITPDYDLEHAPQADVLLIPGGNVSPVMHDQKTLDWVRQRSGEVGTVLSVCTGAFILGQAGLLDGIKSSTIAGASAQLAKTFPKTQVVMDRRYVDNGKIVTTGGLSAGIDGALHVVAREAGRLRAEDVARGIEYEWHPDGKGGFGMLAGMHMPDVAAILPSGAVWERLSERGDQRWWEVRGRVEITASAKDFLDASASTFKQQAWSPVKDKDARHRSFVRTADGRAWRLTLGLVEAEAPSAYQLTLVLKAAPASKS
ncbi:MAG: DJ-1/PfpI family protein [Pseudomonadota bacterium]